MELWLDTINLNVIKEAKENGFLTGVTTNPTILSHADTLPETKLERLLKIQNGYVAVQVIANSFEGILQQAKQLVNLDKQRILIKIPVTPSGLKAIKRLATGGVKTLATAIFEPSQVYLAALAGASYAAPYISQILKTTGEYADALQNMLQIIKIQAFPIKLMAAAISLKEQIVTCAKLGAHAITLPEESYHSLITPHYLTSQRIENFKTAWSSGVHTGQSQLFQPKD